ncbi:MAG: glycosyl hydrolase family 18 protein [Candidatus Shapirobacteria bacterium]
MKTKWIGLVLGLLVLGGIVCFWLLIKNNQKSDFLEPKQKMVVKREMRMIGFIPPWLLGKTQEYCQEVSHLVFLGVESNEEGNLVWDSSSKKINKEEYLRLKENIKRCGGKNMIGFKQFDDEILDKIFSSDTALSNLTEQIKAVVITGGFDGVNIDFEYQSSPTKIMNEKFLSWVKELGQLGEVEVDVFVNTVMKSDKEQLEKLLSAIDDLVIMAYDFHRPGMDVAGAVAPVEDEEGDPSIRKLIERIDSLGLDKKKITLAYPLYGYEWKVEEDEFGAKIKRGWYQVASLGRVKTLIQDSGNMIQESAAKQDGQVTELKDGEMRLNWDDLSQTPWISYKKEGEIYQIYYDDEKSLGIKINLARESGMGGVGFWALGYEGKDGKAWRMWD